MIKTISQLLLSLVLLLLTGRSATAFDPNATVSSVIKATVLSPHFNPPILISPAENALTSNNRETFVWKRPSPIPIFSLSHYDLYLDGQVYAASISDSVISQAYYAYTVERHDDTFYVFPNTDLAQGYHTWSVTAYNIYGVAESSETRKFYIDSIVPFINLEKVDRQTLNWNTADLSSIPDINLRALSVSGTNPLLSGSVEPFSNMQIVLICPKNIPTCRDQTYQGNYPDGTWQHRFYGLIKGYVYTVYISAIDAVGNTVIFPEFYLAYGIKAPVSPAIITPIPTPSLPFLTPTVTPEITPTITPTPTPFIPAPPVSPTPPVFSFQNATQETTTGFNYWFLIYFILVFGLPLHVVMIVYGYKISITNLHRFIYQLYFPFLGNRPYQTLPFSTLYFYDPENLSSSQQTIIANIRGFYSLKSPLLEKYFIKFTATSKKWSSLIFPDNLLTNTCLDPLTETNQDTQKRFRRYSLILSPLPLIIACLTSSVALYIQPNYFYLIYLYLSLHLVYTEYLYKRI